MAPTTRVAHFTTLGKRSSGGLSTSAAVGIAVTFSIIAIIAVVLTTYAYINKWKLPIFQRIAERTRLAAQGALDRTRRTSRRKSQPLQSEVDDKSEAGTERRPGSKTAKYWSAEDMTRSKVGSVKSHVPSVKAFPTDSNVFEPPPTPSTRSDAASGYAQSIFSMKTKATSAFMNRDGTPQIVRPSSKRVKTGSRHISMQFLPDETHPMPSLPPSAMTADGPGQKNKPIVPLEQLLRQNQRSPTDLESCDKRNSRAVVTKLDWMEYEPGAQ